LQRQIERRLRQDPDLNLVKVKVNDRQVTLLGGVPSNVDRQMAFAIANAVPGTAKVRNRLVTLLDTTQRHMAMGADAEAGRQPDIQRR
jgi:osmotically-inducible protein OsmY